MSTQLQQANKYPWPYREISLLLAFLLLSAVVWILVLRRPSPPSPQTPPPPAFVSACPALAGPPKVPEKPIPCECKGEHDQASQPNQGVPIKPAALGTKTKKPPVGARMTKNHGETGTVSASPSGETTSAGQSAGATNAGGIRSGQTPAQPSPQETDRKASDEDPLRGRYSGSPLLDRRAKQASPP